MVAMTPVWGAASTFKPGAFHLRPCFTSKGLEFAREGGRTEGKHAEEKRKGKLLAEVTSTSKTLKDVAAAPAEEAHGQAERLTQAL